MFDSEAESGKEGASFPPKKIVLSYNGDWQGWVKLWAWSPPTQIRYWSYGIVTANGSLYK